MRGAFLRYRLFRKNLKITAKRCDLRATASSSSDNNDLMAEDAVRYEPFSGSKFPANRERYREFWPKLLSEF